MKHNILITGGCGFIGSHVIRHFVKKYPEYEIVNMDILTYVGNLWNVKDVEDCDNYHFVKMDICSPTEEIIHVLRKYEIDGVIHLAAESHVDNSIKDPFKFIRTNVMGTVNLLHACKEYWKETETGYEGKMFYHISTDEVYGSLKIGDDSFMELTNYNPHSPYSSSKASSDHFVHSYHDTYGIPILISHCSNNYGPNQYPEKLIPLFIKNIMEYKQLPVYGSGENIRDWLHVYDHTYAIDLIFHKGKNGETYNIGGNNEWKNIDLIKLLVKQVDEILGRKKSSEYLITHVSDRNGHDLRYSIDSTKIKNELRWTPTVNFNEGLRKTCEWYINNKDFFYKK